jgi:hypothetical protein
MAFSFDLDNKGYTKRRESYNLEYKQNFQLGDNLIKYCKTLVGMANNKDGDIVKISLKKVSGGSKLCHILMNMPLKWR